MDNYFELKNRRYLGAKSKLLSFIAEILEKESLKSNDSMLDLFAGTGVVGEELSKKFKKIYTNDLLTHNYFALNTFFGL